MNFLQRTAVVLTTLVGLASAGIFTRSTVDSYRNVLDEAYSRGGAGMTVKTDKTGSIKFSGGKDTRYGSFFVTDIINYAHQSNSMNIHAAYFNGRFGLEAQNLLGPQTYTAEAIIPLTNNLVALTLSPSQDTTAKGLDAKLRVAEGIKSSLVNAQVVLTGEKKANKDQSLRAEVNGYIDNLGFTPYAGIAVIDEKEPGKKQEFDCNADVGATFPLNSRLKLQLEADLNGVGKDENGKRKINLQDLSAFVRLKYAIN